MYLWGVEEAAREIVSTSIPITVVRATFSDPNVNFLSSYLMKKFSSILSTVLVGVRVTLTWKVLVFLS